MRPCWCTCYCCTTVAWSGANVDATDGYINTSELSTATVTGKVANPNGITGLSISEIT
jgi:hypothetical protein